MGDLPFSDFFEDDDSGSNESARAKPALSENVAVSLALDAAARDASVAREAAAFLRAQREFVEEQRAQLQEGDPLIPAALREGRIRRFSMQVRVGLNIFLAIVATVVALAAGWMVRSASTSHRVVVEAFDTPPSLAPRGIDGRAVASGLLDALGRLRDATRSSFTPLAAQSAWMSEIHVTVPETGVSLGEIDRLLHEHLGQDVHISGELVQTLTGGLALTVRGDGIPAKTFEGGAGDLSKLTEQSAEWIYGRSQPHEYAAYLVANGRDEDALRFLPLAYARTEDDEQRAELANVWGVALIDLNRSAQADEKFRLAMSLKPHFWKAWSNLLSVVPLTEGEEAGWRESQAFTQAGRTAPPGTGPEFRLLGNAALYTWDFSTSLAANLANAHKNGGAGMDTEGAAISVAQSYAALHDWTLAARWIAAADPNDALARAEDLLETGTRAMESGNPAQAVAPLEAFRTIWKSSAAVQSGYAEWCLLGLAYGLTERVAEAEAVFAQNGKWNICYALHGDVLAHTGDIGGAERVWAEGVRIGPDLPLVYLHRGIWHGAHGDAAGAIRDFTIAHDRAPRFADPLKAWGDLLASEGKWREALGKYDLALEVAPGWDALKQARTDGAAKLAGAP